MDPPDFLPAISKIIKEEPDDDAQEIDRPASKENSALKLRGITVRGSPVISSEELRGITVGINPSIKVRVREGSAISAHNLSQLAGGDGTRGLINDGDHLTINDYCRRLIEKDHPHASDVTCLLCGTSIRIRFRHASVQLATLRDHILFHLDVNVYHCRYCDYVSKTLGVMPGHLKSRHSLSTGSSIHFVDSTGQYKDEIFQLMNQCFGKRMDVGEGLASFGTQAVSPVLNPTFPRNGRTSINNGSSSQDANASLLSSALTAFAQSAPKTIKFDQAFIAYCQQVIDANFTQNEIFHCFVCDRRLPQNRSMVDWVRCLFYHAMTHMPPISLYRCHKCSASSNIKNVISDHLKEAHDTRSEPVQFTESTQSYKDEVFQTIDQCFKKKEPVSRLRTLHGYSAMEPPQPLLPMEKAPAPATASTSGSSETKNRTKRTRTPLAPSKFFTPSYYCLQLANQYSRDGFLPCLTCGLNIEVCHGQHRYFDVRNAVDHALSHLGFLLFKCDQCSAWTTTMNAMTEHISTCSAVQSGLGYSNHCEEHYKKIFPILNACYDPLRSNDWEAHLVGDTRPVQRNNESSGGKSAKKRKTKSVAKRRRTEDEDNEEGNTEGDDDDEEYNKSNERSTSSSRSYFTRSARKEKEKVVEEEKGWVFSRLAYLKFRNVQRPLYKCPECRMRTRFQKLMEKHKKFMHSGE